MSRIARPGETRGLGRTTRLLKDKRRIEQAHAIYKKNPTDSLKLHLKDMIRSTLYRVEEHTLEDIIEQDRLFFIIINGSDNDQRRFLSDMESDYDHRYNSKVHFVAYEGLGRFYNMSRHAFMGITGAIIMLDNSANIYCSQSERFCIDILQILTVTGSLFDNGFYIPDHQMFFDYNPVEFSRSVHGIG